MKAQKGSRGIVLLFLYLRRYMRLGGQRHTPAALPPETDPVCIVQEAGWSLVTVRVGTENLGPMGFRTPDRPTRSESIHRLSYPGIPSYSN